MRAIGTPGASSSKLEGIRVVRVKTFITRNQGTVRASLDYLSYMISSFSTRASSPGRTS